MVIYRGLDHRLCAMRNIGSGNHVFAHGRVYVPCEATTNVKLHLLLGSV